MRGLPAAPGPIALPSLRVSTFDQATAAALGIKGVLLSVANAGSAVAGSAPVKVSVGYSGFRHAFGGNYGDRLRLVGLPACAITTPQLRECRIQTPVQDRVNNRSTATVSGVVDLGAAGKTGMTSGSASDAKANGFGAQVFAVLAGSSSETGNWAATPMSQTSSWQAGGSSGDFNYSVPINVPPAPGGLVPQIAMSYSSGGVDGLTKSKNSQASWVGEGWDYHPGFVERGYRPCPADGSPSDSGDLCWAGTSPVTLMLNGKSTRLIDLGAAGWKAEDDSDGWKVERLTGAAVDNGAGEAFKVTTPDGTRYLFGSKRAGGPGEDNNASGQYGGVLEVEVYGNNPGEPCNNSGGFHLSHCSMPYRWNLDRVIDVHGNVVDLEWWRHRGSYGGYGADVFNYDIYGRLTNIKYGANQTTGTVHTGRVEFAGAFRCFDTETACNNDLSLWPDVPWDQFCALNAPSCGQISPTFFNIYRLAYINTYVWQVAAGTWGSVVSQWQTGQGFPANSDGTWPSLWLSNIWQPGFTNPLTMQGTEMANRVDTGLNKPATVHRRVTQINNGVGGTVNVLYSGHDCTGSTPVAQVDFNPKRCFAQSSNGVLSWWHKYVATDVYLGDHWGGGPTERWHYDYRTDWSSTNALWKHDQDWHTAPQYRTWSRWAGYPTVVTTHSEYNGIGPKQVTETLYFRGLNLDWTLTGGPNTKQVTLNDNWVSGRPDDEALAGKPARTLTWDGPINAARSNWTAASRHYYSITNTGTLVIDPPPNIVATRVRESDTYHQTWPTFRETRTVTEYESTYGLPTKVIDYGDTAGSVTNDDRCTHTDYATANTTKWLVGFPKQIWTTTCAASPSASDVLAAARTTFDGLAFGAAPSSGLPTRAEAAKSATAYPPTANDFHQTARFTYDAYGRAVDSFDPLDRQTTTIYSPATGGPVSGVTVRGPSINGQRWDTVTTLDTRFGTPTKVVDVNGKVTQAKYDNAGRLNKVWLNHRAPSSTFNVIPDLEYNYTTGPQNSISTKALGPDGQQLQSFEVFDGRLRRRQVQTPLPSWSGRTIIDTQYDGIGQVAKVSDFYDTASTTGTIAGFDDDDIDRQQRTVYDNFGRIRNVEQWSTDQKLWESIYGYDADKTVTVTPPAGGTATTTVRDARGQVVQLRQHLGGTPAGAVDTTTNYVYDRLGRLKQVKDTNNNEWSYTYDLLGRKTQTVDPDAGTSTITYDNAGQIIQTEDANGNRLFHTYDNLGRKKDSRQDTATTGLLRASWTYDTLAKGQLTSTSRFDGGQAYIRTINSYDDGYRPLSTTDTVPGFGPGGGTLTYTTASTYRANGALATYTLPAVADLDAETLTYEYWIDSGLQQRLTTSDAQGTYINDITYEFDGQLADQELGAPGDLTLIRDYYDWRTGRLSQHQVYTESTGNPDDSFAGQLFDFYKYDPAGNVTSVEHIGQDNAHEGQECFRYDHLRRLTEAWTEGQGDICATPKRAGPDPYWRKWTFDKLGNRLTQVDKDPVGGDTNWTYTVGLAAGVKAHQLKAVTGSGPKAGVARNFSYNAGGGTIGRTTATGASQTLAWDKEGHLASVTEGSNTTSYIYDTTGNRLISSSQSRKTLYLPDGTELKKDGAANPVATRYYGGFAVRDNAGLRWLISDSRGTTTAQVDSSTLAVSKRRSMPFGEDRAAAPAGWVGNKGFVGGTRDETGLTHLGAREYDPSLGRFVSVDPVMELSDPQQWQAYGYGNNNPTTYSDPSGLTPECGHDVGGCNGSSTGPDDESNSSGSKPKSSSMDLCSRGPVNVPSCEPSKPGYGILLGGNLVIAPSQAALEAEIQAEIDRWCKSPTVTDKFFGGGIDGCGGPDGASEFVEATIRDRICQRNPTWCELQDVSDVTLISGVGGIGYSALGQMGQVRRPPHEVNVYVYDANGREVYRYENLKSGEMTAEQKKMGFPLGSLDTHTEKKALRLPIPENGMFIVIEAKYRPCPGCKGRMREHAETHKVYIAYRWDGKVWMATPQASGSKFDTLIRRLTRAKK